jgi:CopG family nickel-responsive transcriptional regulator
MSQRNGIRVNLKNVGDIQAFKTPQRAEQNATAAMSLEVRYIRGNTFRQKSNTKHLNFPNLRYYGAKMPSIVRASATFPPGLLEEFDRTVQMMGYRSRSKAIQDAMRAMIAEHRWMEKEEGTRVGVLVVVFNHHTRDLQKALTEVQHRHRRIICSSMHLHLDEDLCLEAIAVRGPAGQIRELSDTIRSRRGVQFLRPTILST